MNCKTCKKLILESGVTYGINPSAVCKCSNPSDTQNDTSEKGKYHPCNVCGVDAIACLSPDLDIKGLCFCEEHRDLVRSVYTMLMSGVDEKTIRKYMKDWKHT